MNLSNNAVAAGTRVLASILFEIGASERLQVFIDDGLDDDNLKHLSRMKPERISTVYGLSLDQAAAFADKCRDAIAAALPAVSSGDAMLCWAMKNLDVDAPKRGNNIARFVEPVNKMCCLSRVLSELQPWMLHL